MYEPHQHSLVKPSASVPYPRMPAAVGVRFGVENWQLTSFSLCASALEVDFCNPVRPELVTDILRACTSCGQDECVDEDAFWAMTVGTRLGCLLEIAAMESPLPLMHRFGCETDECGETIEVELPLREVAGLEWSRTSPTGVTVPLEHGSVEVRLPTGALQRRWSERRNKADVEDSAWLEVDPPLLGAVVGDLLGPGCEMPRLGSADLRRIEAALCDADPLVDFTIRTTCPRCARDGEYALDLQELALDLLRAKQQELLGAIHRLAAAYHWSESEIVRMPVWRRDYYLQIVESEAD